MLLWFGIIIKTVVVTTVLMEAYLIWLIVRKTPERMASFRFSLLLLVLSELCFTLSMGVLLDAEVLFPITGAAVQGPLRFMGPNGGRYGFTLAICFGAGAFWNQIYCLLFRYTAIQVRFENLHDQFNRWPIRLLFMGIGHLLMAVCGYFAFFCIANQESTISYVQNAQCCAPKEILEYLNNAESSFFIMTQNLHDAKMFSIVVLGGFIGASVLSIAFSITIFGTIQAKASHFTTQMYKLHRQLTLLLIIQFSSPMVFLAVPVVWTIVNAVRGISEDKWMGDVQVLMLCLYTLVNSAVTLAFVCPYRLYTFQLLKTIWLGCRRWTKRGSVAPTTIDRQLQQRIGSLNTTQANVLTNT